MLEALSQIQFEKTEAVLNEQEPIIFLQRDKSFSYDDLAVVVGKLIERLTKTQIDFIVRTGKPLGGGSK